MKHVFDDVRRLVAQMPGWATIKKAEHLTCLTLGLRPRVCVEIGVFAGRSAIPVMLALQEIGTGVLVAIDPWKSDASVVGQTPEHVDFWKHQEYHDSARLKFLSLVSALNLESQLDLRHAASDDVEPPDMIDLLHVDGCHSQQSGRDFQRFGSRVRCGGICVVDDLTWVAADQQGPGTCLPILASLGFKELYRVSTKPQTDDDWAVFQRVLYPQSP